MIFQSLYPLLQSFLLWLYFAFLKLKHERVYNSVLAAIVRQDQARICYQFALCRNFYFHLLFDDKIEIFFGFIHFFWRISDMQKAVFNVYNLMSLEVCIHP